MAHPATKMSAPIALGLAYLGAATALPSQLDLGIAGVTVTTLVATTLAIAGWRQFKTFAGGGQFLALSIVFVTFVLLSAISAWQPETVFRGATLIYWYVFILPGLAGLLRNPSCRWALISGLAAGAVVFGAVVVFRVVSGEPVFDVRSDGVLRKTIFEKNRIAVSTLAVFVAPFVGRWVIRQAMSPIRWVIITLIVAPLYYGGGRAGLAALACALLIYAALLPGIAQKWRAGLLVLLFGSISVIAAWDTSGPLGNTIGRVSSYALGERTSSDEVRDLLNRKALVAARENPFLGVGVGNFVEKYGHHPINDEASTPRARRGVEVGTAHNTYVQVLADVGYPGGFAFYAVLAWVLARAVAWSRHRSVRLATASFGGFLVAIYFEYALGGLLLVALPIVLGSVQQASDDQVNSPDVEPKELQVRT